MGTDGEAFRNSPVTFPERSAAQFNSFFRGDRPGMTRVRSLRTISRGRNSGMWANGAKR